MSIRLNCAWVSLLGFVFIVGCGRYPAQIRTARDIAWTSSDEFALRIHELPLDEYHKLAKFTKVVQIDFRDSADDAKLSALASVGLPALRTIIMGGSRRVSDKGMVALGEGSFPCLQGLQLRGTGITDRSIAIALSWPKIDGLTVEGCAGVTYAGLQLALKSPRIKNIGFSTENLTPDMVRHLLEVAAPEMYIAIADQDGKLNEAELRAIASSKRINLVLRSDYHVPGYSEERR